jgi:hypothetical protein
LIRIEHLSFGWFEVRTQALFAEPHLSRGNANANLAAGVRAAVVEWSAPSFDIVPRHIDGPADRT